MRRPPEVRLENLADVHTRRHAERVEDDLHRRAVRQIRHVLFRQDARDDALVAVAAGHLVADRQLALHRDVDLDQLDDARRQLVAAADLLLLLLEQLADDFDLPLGALLEQPQVALEPRVVALDLQADHLLVRDLLQHVRRQHGALLQQPLAAVLVERVGAQRLVAAASARRASSPRREECGSRPAGSSPSCRALPARSPSRGHPSRCPCGRRSSRRR